MTKSLFDNYYRDWLQDYIIDRAIKYANKSKIFKRSSRRDKNHSDGKGCRGNTSVFYKVVTREPTSFVNRYADKTVEEKCDMLMNTDGQIVKELIVLNIY